MRKTTEQFIEEVKCIHGSKYDYSLIKYETAHTPVLLRCPEHGDFFLKPNTILSQGQGCGKCGAINRKLNNISNRSRAKTTEQFIAESIKVHGNLYDYSKVNYYNAHSKVTIICPEHGEFTVEACSHLKGTKCIACFEATLKGKGVRWITPKHKMTPAILYIVNMKNGEESFEKIGVTSTSMQYRFRHESKLGYEVSELYTKQLNLYDAFLLEQKILNRISERYVPLTYFGGYTECFKLNESINLLLKEYLGINIPIAIV